MYRGLYFAEQLDLEFLSAEPDTLKDSWKYSEVVLYV